MRQQLIKNLSAILGSVLTLTTCLGQTKYEPQILVLSPNEMTYDKVFEKEISNLNGEIKKAEKQASKEKLLSNNIILY